MIGKTIQNIKIRSLLGKGGMGTVYKGVDEMLQREVAIKVLHPELLYNDQVKKRFQTEAIMLASLNHPNITGLFNLIKQEENLLMIMEYVEGQSLEDIIKTKNQLNERESIDIIIQALNGLIHAHDRKIIHRDLKLANIMVSDEGVVKIMDFGIARVLGSSRMTSEGRVIGTLEYMSPEQIKGEEGDERSDIYALGTVLYEMLTGRVPFKNSSDYDLMTTKLNQNPPSMRTFSETVSPQLEKVLFKALKRDPKQRYQSAREFQKALNTFKSRIGRKEYISKHPKIAILNPMIAAFSGFWTSIKNLFKDSNSPGFSKGTLWTGLFIVLSCILIFGVANKLRNKRLAKKSEIEKIKENEIHREEDIEVQDVENDNNFFPQPSAPIILPEENEESENEIELPKEEKPVEKKEIVRKGKTKNKTNIPPKQDEKNEEQEAEKPKMIHEDILEKEDNGESPGREEIDKKEKRESVMRTKKVFLNAGNSIILRLEETISSKTALEGKKVLLTIERDVWVDGAVAIEVGQRLSGMITDVKPATGSKKGRIELVVNNIQTQYGETIPLTASTFRVIGKKGEDISFSVGQTFEVKTAQGIELAAKIK